MIKSGTTYFYCSCGNFLGITINPKTNTAYNFDGDCVDCGKKYDAEAKEIPNGVAVYVWEVKK